VNEERYAKSLTANDTGDSKSHQAGIHVPKGQTGLIGLLPPLDGSSKNPSSRFELVDDYGTGWEIRYIWYNNRHHDADGTRDEYRITCIRDYLKSQQARPGDELVLWRTADGIYRVSLQRAKSESPEDDASPIPRIQLRGWRRVH